MNDAVRPTSSRWTKLIGGSAGKGFSGGGTSSNVATIVRSPVQISSGVDGKTGNRSMTIRASSEIMQYGLGPDPS